jgi:hypothetical protein
MRRSVGREIAQAAFGVSLLVVLACADNSEKLGARNATRAQEGPAMAATSGVPARDSAAGIGLARKNESLGMMIRVEAEQDVTLIDPLGRVDSLAGDTDLREIPGCQRFPGVGSMLIPEGEGQSVPTTMFELDSLVAGEYVLRATAEADGPFFVQVTLTIDGRPACDESDSHEIRRGAMRRWSIGWDAELGADSCKVTIRMIANPSASH